MQHIAPALGVLAGLAGLVGTAPYVRDVVARSTSPQRGTWLIWSLLAIGALEPALLLYPAYHCLVNGALALLILSRRAVYSAAPGGGATSACSRSR